MAYYGKSVINGHKSERNQKMRQGSKESRTSVEQNGGAELHRKAQLGACPGRPQGTPAPGNSWGRLGSPPDNRLSHLIVLAGQLFSHMVTCQNVWVELFIICEERFRKTDLMPSLRAHPNAMPAGSERTAMHLVELSLV